MNRIRRFLAEFGAAIEKSARPEDVSCLPPRELHIELTYRCNTACIMCNLRYLPAGPELSAENIGHLVDHSSLLKDLRFIVLSGGEAFLRDDLVPIVGLLKKKYPATDILILSNLSDPDLAVRRLDELQRSVGLERLCIGSSLDGIGEAHDRIRGRAGSFSSLEKSLALLRQRYPGLYFSLNFTLTPENADQMMPAFEWCEKNGYHISFQVLVQKKETREFAWSQAHLETVERQLDSLVDALARRCGTPVATGYELMAHEGLLSLMLSVHYIGTYIRERRRFFPVCPCGEKYAMVSPDGNVYFCPVHKDLVAGNLRESSFDDIWRSPKAQEIRSFFNRKQCHCWLTCTNGYMLQKALADGKQAFIAATFKQA